MYDVTEACTPASRSQPITRNPCPRKQVAIPRPSNPSPTTATVCVLDGIVSSVIVGTTQLKNHFHFDRRTERQLIHPKRRSSMSACLAKHITNQLRRAIDYQVLVREVAIRIHIA